MMKTIDVLKTYNRVGPGIDTEQSPIEQLNKLFSIRKKSLRMTNSNMKLIKLMNDNFKNDMKDVIGLERFYFDVGFAVIEIMLTINFEKENIIVDPFIYYDESIIKKNIQQVMYREFKLYTLFKKWNLQ